MKTELKRPKVLLGLLVTLALALSMVMGALVMAETPPGANNNNVKMSLGSLPTSQNAGEGVDYYMIVSNPQNSPPFYSADAKDITVTFYPAQADGTPSPSGTVVGSIAYLLVDAAPANIGPVTYPMPALNPGVTAAVSRAVLNGTILLGSGGGQPFSIVKEVSTELINWTIDKTVTDVGGHGPSGYVDKAGDIISYKVVISNTGDVSLQGNLVDSLPGTYNMTGPVESGGNVTGWLEPGENWTYTYKYNAKQSDIDANGINKNGVADGDGDIDNEATFTDNHAVSKSDIEDVPARETCIHIEKSTNGEDADSPTGPYIPIGGVVTWTYNVTNCGSVNLTDIVVTDDNGTPGNTGDDWHPVLVSGDNGHDGVLEPYSQTHEAWIYQASGNAIAGYYANIAYVTGRTQEGAAADPDDDPAHYYSRLPVGWETYAVNKVRVLLPWVTLFAAIIAGTSLLVLRRRRPS